jgi:predicted N-acetyltransferase YhbS
LLLGPLAVACDVRNRGIGTALMHHALDHARRAGHAAVVLVGDEPYYGRFGFSAAPTTELKLPGPCEAERWLGCELVPGALAGARGLVSGTGRLQRAPQRAAALQGEFDFMLPQAA